MILLPSYVTDSRIWGSFRTVLERDFEVVSVDYPGHAGSPMPLAAVDMVAAAEEAAARLSGPAAVVAHGSGAAGAIQLAMRGRVTGLVLFTPEPDEIPAEALAVNIDSVVDPDDVRWMIEVFALSDPADRRRALAEGQARMIGSVAPAHDLDRLLWMFGTTLI